MSAARGGDAAALAGSAAESVAQELQATGDDAQRVCGLLSLLRAQFAEQGPRNWPSATVGRLWTSVLGALRVAQAPEVQTAAFAAVEALGQNCASCTDLERELTVVDEAVTCVVEALRAATERQVQAAGVKALLSLSGCLNCRCYYDKPTQEVLGNRGAVEVLLAVLPAFLSDAPQQAESQQQEADGSLAQQAEERGALTVADIFRALHYSCLLNPANTTRLVAAGGYGAVMAGLRGALRRDLNVQEHGAMLLAEMACAPGVTPGEVLECIHAVAAIAHTQLQDKYIEVARAAVWSLGRLGSMALVPPPEGGPPPRLPGAWPLLAGPVLRMVVAMLQSCHMQDDPLVKHCLDYIAVIASVAPLHDGQQQQQQQQAAGAEPPPPVPSDAPAGPDAAAPGDGGPELLPALMRVAAEAVVATARSACDIRLQAVTLRTLHVLLLRYPGCGPLALAGRHGELVDCVVRIGAAARQGLEAAQHAAQATAAAAAAAGQAAAAPPHVYGSKDLFLVHLYSLTVAGAVTEAAGGGAAGGAPPPPPAAAASYAAHVLACLSGVARHLSEGGGGGDAISYEDRPPAAAAFLAVGCCRYACHCSYIHDPVGGADVLAATRAAARLLAWCGGADGVNAADREGHGALHVLAACGATPLLAAFMEAGGPGLDFLRRTRGGANALQLARGRKHAAAAQLLEEATESAAKAAQDALLRELEEEGAHDGAHAGKRGGAPAAAASGSSRQHKPGSGSLLGGLHEGASSAASASHGGHHQSGSPQHPQHAPGAAAAASTSPTAAGEGEEARRLREELERKRRAAVAEYEAALERRRLQLEDEAKRAAAEEAALIEAVQAESLRLATPPLQQPEASPAVSGDTARSASGGGADPAASKPSQARTTTPPLQQQQQQADMAARLLEEQQRLQQQQQGQHQQQLASSSAAAQMAQLPPGGSALLGGHGAPLPSAAAALQAIASGAPLPPGMAQILAQLAAEQQQQQQQGLLGPGVGPGAEALAQSMHAAVAQRALLSSLDEQVTMLPGGGGPGGGSLAGMRRVVSKGSFLSDDSSVGGSSSVGHAPGGGGGGLLGSAAAAGLGGLGMYDAGGAAAGAGPGAGFGGYAGSFGNLLAAADGGGGWPGGGPGYGSAGGSGSGSGFVPPTPPPPPGLQRGGGSSNYLAAQAQAQGLLGPQPGGMHPGHPHAHDLGKRPSGGGAPDAWRGGAPPMPPLSGGHLHGGSHSHMDLHGLAAAAAAAAAAGADASRPRLLGPSAPPPPPGRSQQSVGSASGTDLAGALQLHEVLSGGGGGGGGPEMWDLAEEPSRGVSRQLWLGNVHAGLPPAHLQALCSQFGPVLEAVVAPGTLSAGILFARPDAAQRAAHALHGQSLPMLSYEGKPLVVRYCRAGALPAQQRQHGPPPPPPANVGPMGGHEHAPQGAGGGEGLLGLEAALAAAGFGPGALEAAMQGLLPPDQTQALHAALMAVSAAPPPPPPAPPPQPQQRGLHPQHGSMQHLASLAGAGGSMGDLASLQAAGLGGFGGDVPHPHLQHPQHNGGAADDADGAGGGAAAGGSTGEGGSVSGEQEGGAGGDGDLPADVPEGKPSRHLWLGNIPLKPNKLAMELLFARFGPLESVRVFPGKTFAFVNYLAPQHAVAAKMALDGQPAPSVTGSKPMVIRYQKDTSTVPANLGLAGGKSMSRSSSAQNLTGLTAAASLARLLDDDLPPEPAVNLSNKLNPNNIHYDRELAARYKRMSKAEKEALWAQDRAMQALGANAAAVNAAVSAGAAGIAGLLDPAANAAAARLLAQAGLGGLAAGLTGGHGGDFLLPRVMSTGALDYLAAGGHGGHGGGHGAAAMGGGGHGGLFRVNTTQSLLGMQQAASAAMLLPGMGGGGLGSLGGGLDGATVAQAQAMALQQQAAQQQAALQLQAAQQQAQALQAQLQQLAATGAGGSAGGQQALLSNLAVSQALASLGLGGPAHGGGGMRGPGAPPGAGPGGGAGLDWASMQAALANLGLGGPAPGGAAAAAAAAAAAQQGQHQQAALAALLQQQHQQGPPGAQHAQGGPAGPQGGGIPRIGSAHGRMMGPGQGGLGLMDPSAAAALVGGLQGAGAPPPARPPMGSFKQVPPSFLCPLTRTLMADPVVAADGITYNRQAIAEWLRQHDSSPVTRQPLANKMLTPNVALRNAIIQELGFAGAPA